MTMSPHNRKAKIIMADCVNSISLRRLMRSAMTPPSRENASMGALEAKPTTPSQKAGLAGASCSTSHPMATFCIQVPMLERKLPLQNQRKSRLRRARIMCGMSPLAPPTWGAKGSAAATDSSGWEARWPASRSSVHFCF